MPTRSKTPSTQPQKGRRKQHELDELLSSNVERDRAQHAPPVAATPQAQQTKTEEERDPEDEYTEWIDIDLIDDNPYQTRSFLDPVSLKEMAESLNGHGQLQAAVARTHPRNPNRIQLAGGHRRKHAIKKHNANAGSHLPNAHQYIGKMRVTVRPISNVDMLTLAIVENEDREPVALIDRAKSYRKAFDLAKSELEDAGQKADIMIVWARVGRGFNRSYQTLKRVADLLDLPPHMVKAIEQGKLNERHGRALLDLKTESELQEQLFQEILKNKLSGNASEGRAKVLLKGEDSSTQSHDSGNGNVKAELKRTGMTSRFKGKSKRGAEQGAAGSSSATGAASAASAGSSGAASSLSGHPLSVAESKVEEATENLARFEPHGDFAETKRRFSFFERKMVALNAEYNRVAKAIATAEKKGKL